MEPVDLIIANGTILTMDDGNTRIEDGFVCVREDRITHLGAGSPPPFRAARTLDARGGLILPGLVNGHTHAAMSLFRGLADDLPLMDWLNHYIFPVEKRMDADFVRAGTRLACAEMILSGTTAFCDMYLFEDAVATAAREAGMRCLVGEVLYDFPSPNYGPVDQGLAYSAFLIEKWSDDPLVSVAVEPHALYTCSPDLLQRANDLALRYKVPLIVHLAESRSEIVQVRDTYGKTPVAHLAALGVLGKHLIADHCVHLDPSDIRTLAASGARVVHNPESNLKLASGIAPIPEILAAGVTIGLGTDGCASNNNLDMFSEMDTAAKLHKVNTLDPTVMDAVTVLRMATIEGARALGLDHLIGSLEVGKKADVIVVDTRKPHLTPMYNPVSHLVYAAKGSDVAHSVIDGRVVMEDRRLETLDRTEVLAAAREKADLVRQWLA